MRGQDGLELRVAIGFRPHCGQEAHPEQGHGRVKFPRVAGRARKGANRRAHPLAGFVDRAALLQIDPGEAQVLAMMKGGGGNLAAFEQLGVLPIGHVGLLVDPT